MQETIATNQSPSKVKWSVVVRFIFGVVLLVFFIFLMGNVVKLGQMFHLMASISLRGVIIVLILEAIFIASRGFIYKDLFKIVEIDIEVNKTIPLHLASYTVNILVPSMSLAGVGVFIDYAARHALSKTKIVIANILFYFFDYCVLTVLVALSCLYLLQKGKLDNGEIVVTVLFAIFIVLFAALVILITSFNGVFIKLATGLWRWLRRVFRKLRYAISADELQNKLSSEMRTIKSLIAKNRQYVFRVLMIFLFCFAVEVAMLYIVYLALGVRVALPVIIASYSFGLLFMLLSVTPSGLGFAEPAMAIVLISMGVGSEVALAGVLIFRLITYWLPLPFGLYFFKKQVWAKSNNHKNVSS